MSTIRDDTLSSILASQLADPDNHWGLGSFGAIAEFTRDRGEPATLDLTGPMLSAITPRGGIRIDTSVDARATAFETAAGASWNQNIALCLPQDSAAMNGRAALTELGFDTDALRAADKAATLFDLGLGIPHVDACIRIHDPAVAMRLRGYVDRNVFAAENDVMHVILVAAPHRVFISRCGRVEVYQPIPPPDGRSPEGPHTHVLPKLLARDRTHAATEPIPEGWVPCLSVYPAHPAKDANGSVKLFEQERHQTFQSLLDRYGHPRMIALKRRVAAAIERREPPGELDDDDRFSKACVRIALRQAQASGVASPVLDLWRAKYERPDAADASDMTGCH
ncbi:MAG: DUF6925 family protein [Pseudolabrys sp.]